MLLKLTIILSGNSFFIHLLFPKLFPNIPGVIPGIVKVKWSWNGYSSAAENITTCKHKNYTQTSDRAVTAKLV